MQKKINKIKAEIQLMGDMRQGSLSEQYTKCGRAGCSCQDTDKPKLHGPYSHLRYTYRGKSTTQFIQKPQLISVKKQLASYKKFRKLIMEWVDLSQTISMEKFKIEKELLMKK